MTRTLRYWHMDSYKDIDITVIYTYIDNLLIEIPIAWFYVEVFYRSDDSYDVCRDGAESNG